MINIGVSKMGMNPPSFYNRLLNSAFKSININTNECAVEYVNFDSPYDYILFDGGSDVSPEFYGEENIHSYIDKLRDDYEKSIFEHYKDTTTKFTGICRGHQFLNVMYGGTLIQNLGSCLLSHPAYHYIRVSGMIENSFKNILPRMTEVNSMHHQAVNKLAKNLYAIAFEPHTSIIEVYGEMDDKVRAVQFHPEFANSFPYTKEILAWLFRIL